VIEGRAVKPAGHDEIVLPTDDSRRRIAIRMDNSEWPLSAGTGARWRIPVRRAYFPRFSECL